MTRDEAMQLARAEYRRGIMDGMGINLIAEAWDIPRYQVVRHGDGYGLMTEGYLLAEMAKQIMEMDLGSDRVASEVRQLRCKARETMGNLDNQRSRKVAVR
tara:strand:+ start:301 stop:603 length:303 start_codon:yes stop_codon:yes gene_type:complete